MKKLGSSLACAAALLLLGLPPLLGRLTESQVAARVAAIDSHPLLAATLVEYRRGWFWSTAKVELGLDPRYAAQRTAAAGVPPPFPSAPPPIAVELAHGPVAVGRGVQLGWSAFVARLDPEHPDTQALLGELRVPYLFEFRGRTSYTGALRFDADMPALEAEQQGLALAFSRVTLDGELAGRDLRWRLAVPSVRTTGDGSSMAAESLAGSGTLRIHSPYVLTGSADLRLARVRASGALDEPLFELTGVQVAGTSELDAAGELLSGTVTYAAASATGPGIEIADARIGLGVANLDAAALEAYYAALERSAGAGAAMPQEQLLEELAPVLQRALARSPSFAVDPIRFHWRGEPFDGAVRIQVDSAALPPAAAFDVADPLVWMEAAQATARARLSKALAQDVALQIMRMQLAMMGGGDGMPPEQLDYLAGAQAGLMLVTLVGQGYLRDDGESYSLELRFANGGLTINGHPLPLPFP